MATCRWVTKQAYKGVRSAFSLADYLATPLKYLVNGIYHTEPVKHARQGVGQVGLLPEFFSFAKQTKQIISESSVNNAWYLVDAIAAERLVKNVWPQYETYYSDYSGKLLDLAIFMAYTARLFIRKFVDNNSYTVSIPRAVSNDVINHIADGYSEAYVGLLWPGFKSKFLRNSRLGDELSEREYKIHFYDKLHAIFIKFFSQHSITGESFKVLRDDLSVELSQIIMSAGSSENESSIKDFSHVVASTITNEIFNGYLVSFPKLVLRMKDDVTRGLSLESRGNKVDKAFIEKIAQDLSNEKNVIAKTLPKVYFEKAYVKYIEAFYEKIAANKAGLKAIASLRIMIDVIGENDRVFKEELRQVASNPVPDSKEEFIAALPDHFVDTVHENYLKHFYEQIKENRKPLQAIIDRMADKDKEFKMILENVANNPVPSTRNDFFESLPKEYFKKIALNILANFYEVISNKNADVKKIIQRIAAGDSELADALEDIAKRSEFGKKPLVFESLPIAFVLHTSVMYVEIFYQEIKRFNDNHQGMIKKLALGDDGFASTLRIIANDKIKKNVDASIDDLSETLSRKFSTPYFERFYLEIKRKNKNLDSLIKKMAQGDREFEAALWKIANIKILSGRDIPMEKLPAVFFEKCTANFSEDVSDKIKNKDMKEFFKRITLKQSKNEEAIVRSLGKILERKEKRSEYASELLQGIIKTTANVTRTHLSPWLPVNNIDTCSCSKTKKIHASLSSAPYFGGNLLLLTILENLALVALPKSQNWIKGGAFLMRSLIYGQAITEPKVVGAGHCTRHRFQELARHRAYNMGVGMSVVGPGEAMSQLVQLGTGIDTRYTRDAISSFVMQIVSVAAYANNKPLPGQNENPWDFFRYPRMITRWAAQVVHSWFIPEVNSVEKRQARINKIKEILSSQEMFYLVKMIFEGNDLHPEVKTIKEFIDFLKKKMDQPEVNDEETTKQVLGLMNDLFKEKIEALKKAGADEKSPSHEGIIDPMPAKAKERRELGVLFFQKLEERFGALMEDSEDDESIEGAKKKNDEQKEDKQEDKPKVVSASVDAPRQEDAKKDNASDKAEQEPENNSNSLLGGIILTIKAEQEQLDPETVKSKINTQLNSQNKDTLDVLFDIPAVKATLKLYRKDINGAIPTIDKIHTVSTYAGRVLSIPPENWTSPFSMPLLILKDEAINTVVRRIEAEMRGYQTEEENAKASVKAKAETKPDVLPVEKPAAAKDSMLKHRVSVSEYTKPVVKKTPEKDADLLVGIEGFEHQDLSPISLRKLGIFSAADKAKLPKPTANESGGPLLQL